MRAPTDASLTSRIAHRLRQIEFRALLVLFLVPLALGVYQLAVGIAGLTEERVICPGEVERDGEQWPHSTMQPGDGCGLGSAYGWGLGGRTYLEQKVWQAKEARADFWQGVGLTGYGVVGIAYTVSRTHRRQAAEPTERRAAD